MSDLYLALNGERVISADVMVPFYGAWVADVVLAESTAVPTRVTLTLANLALKGATVRTASYAGARSARLVGGAGGWRKTLAARQYYLPGGVRTSMVLADAARELGETLALATDATLGSFWTRDQAPGAHLLRELAGDLWYVDPAGVTQVGKPRAAGAIASDFQVVSRSGAKGAFVVATEALADWVPGRTFTAPTVTDVQMLSLVRFRAENGGQLRVEALAA